VGQTHAKTARDAAPLAYPNHAALDTATGWQGYEPAGPQTRPPQKAQRHRGAQWGAGPPHELLSGAWRRRAHALRGQTRPHGHRCFAPHHSRHLGAREGECVRLAQSPRFLVSPAASFRVTALLWQHL